MEVYLKHVGVTDLVRETLKMSVKTLASWSLHALSTRPGKSSDPAGLLIVLLTSATESVITQLSGTAGALKHASVLLASKRAYNAFSSSSRLSLGSSCWVFLCSP